MACFNKIFSKSCGFNPTSMPKTSIRSNKVSSNVETGRYIFRSEDQYNPIENGDVHKPPKNNRKLVINTTSTAPTPQKTQKKIIKPLPQLDLNSKDTKHEQNTKYQEQSRIKAKITIPLQDQNIHQNSNSNTENTSAKQHHSKVEFVPEISVSTTTTTTTATATTPTTKNTKINSPACTSIMKTLTNASEKTTKDPTKLKMDIKNTRTIPQNSAQQTDELQEEKLFLAKQLQNQKNTNIVTSKENNQNLKRQKLHHHRHHHHRNHQHQENKNQHEKQRQQHIDRITQLIGNKDYEEARRNRQPPQYGTPTVVPVYLEELKQKQQQQQQQLLLQNACRPKSDNITEILRKDNRDENFYGNDINGGNKKLDNDLKKVQDNEDQIVYKTSSPRCISVPANLTLNDVLSNDNVGVNGNAVETKSTNDNDKDNYRNDVVVEPNSILDDSGTSSERKEISNLIEDKENIKHTETLQAEGGKRRDTGRDSGVQIDDPHQPPNNNVNQTTTNSRPSNNTNVSVESDTSEQNSSDNVQALRKGFMFIRPNLSNNEEQEIPTHTKDEKTRKLIRKAIENNDFLNNYMDSERKERVIDAMEPAFYDKGKFIIRENEEGSEIYVSEVGVFEVIKNDEFLNTLGPGIVFGELAILYDAKRFASIKAISKAKVWKIDRSRFRTIMFQSGSKEREENLIFLKQVPFLKDLSEDVLIKIVDLLKRVFFPSDTCIVRQGDVGNNFFIIRGGSVIIKKTNEFGDERVVARRKRGDYFGEQALLNTEYRQASVYAEERGTECLKLDRESFINYLGTIADLKKKPKENINVPANKPRATIIRSEYDHIEFNDLKKVTTLGAGAFGRVDLVTYKDKESFALKIIKKIAVLKQAQIDHIYNEKLVMSMCHDSPFIVELYKTFRDSKYVYFLMEACLGGDVWTIMYQRKFFDERTARFISGCVVEAFSFLHANNIIFRDLKPENLMLTTDGYCKLVDFGFAKRLNPNIKTNTFAGTPEYVAPEIILDRGHDRAVDYWALGILIYELLVGRTPFRGTNQMKIYQQILGGIEAVKMPTKIPKTAQNLIKNLCRQMPAERLGYQKRGILDIKKHSWFDGFSWQKLQNRQMTSPIKRSVNGITDTQHFPTQFEHENDDPPDENSGWDINF